MLHLNEGKLSSHIQRKGIAMDDKHAIAAVLGTYISMCQEARKDTVKLLGKNLTSLKEIITKQRHA